MRWGIQKTNMLWDCSVNCSWDRLHKLGPQGPNFRYRGVRYRGVLTSMPYRNTTDYMNSESWGGKHPMNVTWNDAKFNRLSHAGGFGDWPRMYRYNWNRWSTYQLLSIGAHEEAVGLFRFCHDADKVAAMELGKLDTIFCNIVAIAFIEFGFYAFLIKDFFDLLGV